MKSPPTTVNEAVNNDDIARLCEQIHEFVVRVCIPEEAAWRASGHAVSDELRWRLIAQAKDEGLYGPHLPREYGGADIDQVARAKVFEAAGYSVLGPMALHCASPDEGNQHLLHKVAVGAQREEFLKPLCEGHRSCFMMTEPGGAGADPSLMKTVAVADGDDYLISGKKWFITGAKDAQFAIIMAREGESKDAPASMFLVPMDTPGIDVTSEMDVMGHDSSGGHCEVTLDKVRVHKNQVLGEPGRGFQYAQLRLAPARLTHCMRWLGAAIRCHDIARHHAARRRIFGARLGEHQGIGFMLADNEIDIYVSRQAIASACAVIDAGNKGRHESSMVKVFVSESTSRIVDRCVQILGGLGITAYTPVEHIYRSIRAFRLYDGPSETHRWAISRRILPAEDAAAPSLYD